jgi:hypothetical protein
MRLTPCECIAAGWCERHQCLKPDRSFHQCRRSQTAFQAWEDRRGPCLPLLEDYDVNPSTTEMPSLSQRILNLGAATVRHAANGFRYASEAVRDSRLLICRQCPSCDAEHMVCREQSCGCVLQIKASWASESCPRGSWPITAGEPERPSSAAS